MKKIVKLFGIMTIAAALLISCKPTTEDPTNPDAGKISDPNKTEQTGGTATGSEEEKEKNEEKEDSSTIKVSYTLDTSGIWSKEDTTATQTDDNSNGESSDEAGKNDNDIISSLDLTNLGSGWDSSYDATTKTITFDAAWTGRGWWEPAVPEGAKKIKFTFNETTGSEIKVQIVGEYIDESLNNKLEVEAGSKTAVYELKDSAVKQIYIQGFEKGSLSLVACDWTK